MKLIERIFGKKEQQSPEIRFEELQEWLAVRREKLSDDMTRQSASIFQEVKGAIRKIRKSTSLLEETTLDGRYHLKMVKIASSNRDNMVKQVGVLVENIKIPETTDIRTIIDFHKNALQTLGVCLENMHKSYQYAKLVFLEESKQVISDVNTLGRLLNQLVEPINENKKTLEALDKAAETMEIIKGMNSDAGIEIEAIKEIDDNIALHNKEILKNTEAYNNFIMSQQWKQYLDQNHEIREFENKAEKIESEINGMILPLNKALNRLSQLSESGRYTLAPDTREGLRLCLSDPKCVNPGFLVELRKIIESDILALAPGKREKMLEQVQIAGTSFEERKKKYQSLILEIEKKKDDISRSDIAQEEKRMRESINAFQDRLALEEKRLEKSKKHLENIEHGVELKKQDLQNMISMIDEKVKVLF